jgi:hypothetical protein
MRKIRSIAERFWDKVSPEPNSGCWLWTGGLANGYAVIQRGKRGEGLIKAHRLALTLSGVNVPDDLLVCHSCDVPLCVNPAHLYVGTQSDNMRDSHRRKRRDYSKLPRGDDHWLRRGEDTRKMPAGDQHYTRRRMCVS